MKRIFPVTFLLAASALGTTLHAQSPAPAASATPAPSAFASEKERISYSIGVDIAKSFKRQGLEVDPAVLTKGFIDMTSGATLQMTQEQMATTLREFQQAQVAKAQESRKAASAGNEAEGVKFLAENKSKPDVVTLPDGLEYKVLTQGTGPTPKETDTVTVNYRGTLINGTEFDSSYKRNEPATFPVNGVIKGWTEILQMMKVGSKYQVFIPANLAYGDRGAGQDIAPGSTLIFEVELLSIK